MGGGPDTPSALTARRAREYKGNQEGIWWPVRALALQGVTEIRAGLDIDACTAVPGAPRGDLWRFDTGGPGCSSGPARLPAGQALSPGGAHDPHAIAVFTFPQSDGTYVIGIC